MAKYGTGSEKLSDAQLELLELERRRVNGHPCRKRKGGITASILDASNCRPIFAEWKFSYPARRSSEFAHNVGTSEW